MTARPRVVVCGIDGSASSETAARWAAEEAHRRQADLLLVQAFWVPIAYGGPGAIMPPDLLDGARDLAERSLAYTESNLRSSFPDVKVSTELAMETPLAALLEASRNALLTVVGSHGMGVFSQTVLGSVAQKMASHSFGPVVVVRADPHDKPAESTGLDAPVMVGLDGSAESEVALRFAFEEASTRGVELLAVHVWDDRPLNGISRVYPLELDRTVVDADQNQALADQLAGWAEKYPDVSTSRAIRRGRASGALIACAVEMRPSLLVVGSRGRGGWAGLLLGSTSSELVAYAPCPVAVVHAGSG